ncbi:hypothetical protein Tco_1108240 [Tanacetum coccineum]
MDIGECDVRHGILLDQLGGALGVHLGHGGLIFILSEAIRTEKLEPSYGETYASMAGVGLPCMKRLRTCDHARVPQGRSIQSIHGSVKMTKDVKKLYCWPNMKADIRHYGPEIVQETTERIIQVKQRMQAARSTDREVKRLKRSRNPIIVKVRWNSKKVLSLNMGTSRSIQEEISPPLLQDCKPSSMMCEKP